MTLDADKLDALAKFLDDFDDDLAAEARRMAGDIRKGLVSLSLMIVEVPDGQAPQVDRRSH